MVSACSISAAASSLIGNLTHLGLAYLKLDGCYLHAVDREGDKRLFIEAVHRTTHSIDLPLIAEQVETLGELRKYCGKWVCVAPWDACSAARRPGPGCLIASPERVGLALQRIRHRRQALPLRQRTRRREPTGPRHETASRCSTSTPRKARSGLGIEFDAQGHRALDADLQVRTEARYVQAGTDHHLLHAYGGYRHQRLDVVLQAVAGQRAHRLQRTVGKAQRAFCPELMAKRLSSQMCGEQGASLPCRSSGKVFFSM